MEEQTDHKVSKFSSGINILLRIDSIWKDANTHSRAGHFEKWNLDLDNIWRELAADLIAKKKYDEKSKIFYEFDEKLAKTGAFLDTGMPGFKKPEQKDIKNRSEQYKLLCKKELFLRTVENDVGKGTTWDDDEDDEF